MSWLIILCAIVCASFSLLMFAYIDLSDRFCRAMVENLRLHCEVAKLQRQDRQGRGRDGLEPVGEGTAAENA